MDQSLFATGSLNGPLLENMSIQSRFKQHRSVLEKVWKYSSETETHTVETHIHRLRKKILEKFGDDNFIKNNNEGYYI